VTEGDSILGTRSTRESDRREREKVEREGTWVRNLRQQLSERFVLLAPGLASSEPPSHPSSKHHPPVSAARPNAKYPARVGRWVGSVYLYTRERELPVTKPFVRLSAEAARTHFLLLTPLHATHPLHPFIQQTPTPVGRLCNHLAVTVRERLGRNAHLHIWSSRLLLSHLISPARR